MAKLGKIYFLRRADGLIKIGFSATFKARLDKLTKSHGPLHIVRVINGDRRREKQLHHAFQRAHEFGEWFRCEEWVLPAIHALPEGDAISLSANEAQRRWKAGEQEFADKARDKIERLVLARRQRTGQTNVDCLAAVEADYGIRTHFMTHIMAGRASSVSAYAMALISQSLIAELEALRDQLLSDLAAVESGEPIPDRAPVRQRYQRSPDLAALVQAKKQARAVK